MHPMVINAKNAIARGRYLHKLEYKSGDTYELFTIEVIDKENGTARKSYFNPEKSMQAFAKEPEYIKKQQGKFNSVIGSLTSALLGSEYETGQVSNFKEFCEKIMADIPKSLFRKELRVKVVLDKQDRPTLPPFGAIFEDCSVVSDADSKLEIRDPWDKVEPSGEVAPAVAMDKDPLPSKLANPMEESDDDLPFK